MGNKVRGHKPFVVIVSAPSGGGKTTIVNMVLEKLPGITRSVSCTTRDTREGELNNEDYIFLSETEFKEQTEKDMFLEWEQNFGNYYGTREEQVREKLLEGEDVILNIDVKGARRVKRKIPESISVFIMPPSIEELAERLEKRNANGLEEVEIRLKESEKEMAAADEYDYLVENSDLEQAVTELCEIIEIERKNRKLNRENK